MTADERRDLTARYDRLTARIRHMDAMGWDIPQELKLEQERMRRLLDGLMED